MFRLRKAKVWFAFLVKLSTWGFQDRDLLIDTPGTWRYRHAAVGGHRWSSHTWWGFYGWRWWWLHIFQDGTAWAIFLPIPGASAGPLWVQCGRLASGSSYTRDNHQQKGGLVTGRRTAYHLYTRGRVRHPGLFLEALLMSRCIWLIWLQRDIRGILQRDHL